MSEHPLAQVIVGNCRRCPHGMDGWPTCSVDKTIVIASNGRVPAECPRRATPDIDKDKRIAELDQLVDLQLKAQLATYERAEKLEAALHRLSEAAAAMNDIVQHGKAPTGRDVGRVARALSCADSVIANPRPEAPAEPDQPTEGDEE